MPSVQLPQDILDGLSDWQSKFFAAQDSDAALATSQTALVAAQTAVDSNIATALANHQAASEQGQKVLDLIRKDFQLPAVVTPAPLAPPPLKS